MVSIAAVIWSPLAWIGSALVLYTLIALQMRYHERVEAWKRALKTVQVLLLATSRLGADAPDAVPDAAGYAVRLSRSLSRSLVARISPSIGSYGDWFALANVKHYYKAHAIVVRERAFLQACWLHCAALEADAVLARHLSATTHWCWAETGDELAIEDGIHPLLAAPVGLSIALQGRGAFISGPNGAGKSTFLRMVGLNLVLARAFGFCHARTATVPMQPVYASMQNEDSLLDGQSLYISELARARALLSAANGPHPGVCLVDEIFRKIHRATDAAVDLSSSATSYLKGANGTTGIKPDVVWDNVAGAPGLWADLTTKGQWGAHVRKYGAGFGEGIPILYERGKGVIDTTKLKPGAGFGFGLAEALIEGGK